MSGKSQTGEMLRLSNLISYRSFPSEMRRKCMRFYERRLPHWDVVGQPLFVTFRLHDSLPINRVFLPSHLTNGKTFVTMDRLLDQAATGPKHLAVPEIAALVVASLQDGERRFRRYQLHSFVVLPNHVHLLVTPSVEASRWLRTL
jgi:putative transposase